jgi:hypothetical protein
MTIQHARATSLSRAIESTHPRPRDVMAGLVPAIHARTPRRLKKFGLTPKLRRRPPWDESVDSGRFPSVSQLLGVDGRDEPGHDGHSVSQCVNLLALEGIVYRGRRHR